MSNIQGTHICTYCGQTIRWYLPSRNRYASTETYQLFTMPSVDKDSVPVKEDIDPDTCELIYSYDCPLCGQYNSSPRTCNNSSE
jgi:hypothetical protein